MAQDIGRALFQALLAGSKGLAGKTLREQQIADEMRQEMMKREAAMEMLRARTEGQQSLEELRAALRAALEKDKFRNRNRLEGRRQKGQTKREKIRQRRQDKRQAERLESQEGQTGAKEAGRNQRARERNQTSLTTAAMRAGASGGPTQAQIEKKMRELLQARGTESGVLVGEGDDPLIKGGLDATRAPVDGASLESLRVSKPELYRQLEKMALEFLSEGEPAEEDVSMPSALADLDALLAGG